MASSDRTQKRGWATILLVACAPGWLACAGESEAGADGPGNVDARVDVVVDEATVAGTFTPLVTSFVSDDAGIYWYDGRGAVLSQRTGESEVALLKPPLARPEGESLREFVIGMADDEERLFVGQAFLQTGGVVDFFPVPEFVPPGRLLVIPKSGGAARVVVELEDATITPIASDATRVIVHVEGANGGYYQLIRSSLELERLPLTAPFYSSYRGGDTLYWSNGYEPYSLFRSGFDDAEPTILANVERGEIDVGPGYVLTRQERLSGPPDYVVEQNFVLHDAAGGERALPGLGATISLQTALDARHAYWFSYLGAGPTLLPPAEPAFRLVRVDIETGALTVVNTPDFQLESLARILGQNASQLYIESGGQIVAVQKP